MGVGLPDNKGQNKKKWPQVTSGEVQIRCQGNLLHWWSGIAAQASGRIIIPGKVQKTCSYGTRDMVDGSDGLGSAKLTVGLNDLKGSFPT